MEKIALSATQREMLELEQYGGSSATGICADLKIPGTVDKEIFLQVMHRLMESADVFQMKIVRDAGEMMLVCAPEEAVPLDPASLFITFNTQEEYLAWVQERIRQGLPCTGPLYRFVCAVFPDRFIFFIQLSHLVFDAWSLSRIGELFYKAYQACLKGKDVSWTNGSYLKFLKKENAYLESARYRVDQQYWKECMDRYHELVLWSSGKSTSLQSERKVLALEAQLSDGILDFCRWLGISETVFFMTVFSLYFHRISGNRQFYIGSTVINRQGREEMNTLGLFANSIPLLFDFTDEKMTLRQLFQQVEDTLLSGYRHQKYTNNSILKDHQLGKLFDIGLNFQVAPVLSEEGVQIEIYHCGTQTESLALHINRDGKNRHLFYYDYQVDMLEAWEIEILHDHLSALFSQILTEESLMDRPVNQVRLFSPEERERVLHDFNSRQRPVPNQTIDEMFEEQVKMRGEKTAIIHPEKQISYIQLNQLANAIACRLRDRGIGRGDYVAIATRKNIDTVAAIFGVLKTGAAYVPVDITYPRERISYILHDCRPVAIVYPEGTDLLNEEIPAIFCKGEKEEYFEKDERNQHGADDVAYVIYTSGTTGNPKGVVLEHAGIASLRSHFVEDRYFTPEDVVLHFFNFSFDASLSELTMSVLSGGTCLMITEDMQSDLPKMQQYLQEHHVTMGAFPVPILMQLKNLDMKLVMTAGSESNREVVKRFSTQSIYCNEYGPTEVTVCGSSWMYQGGKIPRRIPIGQPMVNKKIYIMNGEELCGIGMTGEICIAGAGIARGYLNQTNLTAEKFVSNPFGEGRMYRTGDMGRWKADGNLEYLGRQDRQVKIRGYRIEISEIEEALRGMEGILDAVVVISRTDPSGDASLEAYVLLTENKTMREIKEKLREKLPYYMIPSGIYRVSELPLTHNGKLDEKRLKDFVLQEEKHLCEDVTEQEEKLLGFFRAVLGESYQVDDDIFENGGDSIRVIRIASSLQDAGYPVTVRMIISYPTVRLLSQAIVPKKSRARRVSGWSRPSPMQTAFLGWEKEKQPYFAQTVLLECRDEIERYRSRKALMALMQQHGMLRACLREDRLFITEGTGRESILLKTAKADNRAEAVAYLDHYKARFDLKQGPLLQGVLFEGEYHGLALTVHHLAVDAISWNILVKDFLEAYEQPDACKEKQETRGSSSYLDWIDMLEKHLQDEKGRMEQDWTKALLHDPGNRASFRQRKRLEQKNILLELKEDETKKMLYDCCYLYSTDPLDLLSAAVSMAIHAYTGDRYCVIQLEGHGRAAEQEELKIENTVGWFTCAYPVVVKADASIRELIIQIKDRRRSMPDQGHSYGLLRYWEKRETYICFPSVVLNFLGNEEVEIPEGSAWNIHIPETNMSEYALMDGSPMAINGIIREGKLMLTISCNVLDSEEMQTFAGMLREKIQKVIAHCASSKKKEMTASDFGLEMSSEAFDEIMNLLS